MHRHAVAYLLAALVPAGAVLSGQPVTNETIQNAVASLATLTPGGKWKTSCTGAFVDLDGLGNLWRNGTWWFATAAHCLADEDKNVDLSTLPNMALLRTHFGDQATPEFESYEKIGTLEDAVAKWILGNNTDTMGATTVTCPLLASQTTRSCSRAASRSPPPSTSTTPSRWCRGRTRAMCASADDKALIARRVLHEIHVHAQQRGRQGGRRGAIGSVTTFEDARSHRDAVPRRPAAPNVREGQGSWWKKRSTSPTRPTPTTTATALRVVAA
jgi:hypothetical protein